MADLSPLLGEERKSDLRAVRSVDDPGCVKTRTSRECEELFSLFSSFDGGCQSGSFVIQRDRDRSGHWLPDYSSGGTDHRAGGRDFPFDRF
jgi:hypothetical protein